MIFESEPHSHPIIKDSHGILRWEEDYFIKSILDKISLNDLIPLFIHLGHGKNSELHRLSYRGLGYSLSGYWEIFYWEMNNPNANEYVYNKL